MNKINKIQNLLTKYMQLRHQFDNYQRDIDSGDQYYDDEILVYTEEYYGENVIVYEMEQCIRHISNLQEACRDGVNESDPALCFQQVQVPEKVFAHVDIANLRIEIDTRDEIDPYEDFMNTYTYINFYGFVPWGEEQQEQHKKECKQKMAGIALDMHKVQEELLELGVDILGE